MSFLIEQIGLINSRANISPKLLSIVNGEISIVLHRERSWKGFPGEIQDAWPRLTLTELHSCETAAGLLSDSCMNLYDLYDTFELAALRHDYVSFAWKAA